MKVPVKQEVLKELHEMYKDKSLAEIIREIMITCSPVDDGELVLFKEYRK